MTALERRMRSVRAATAASATAGEEIRKSGPVVLADREHVQPDLLGELGLLQQIAHPLLRADAGAEVGEGGDSEFHAGDDSRNTCADN